MTNEISVKIKIDSNSKELILEVNKLIESLFKKADSEIQKTGKILENQLKAYSNTVQNGTNRYTETVDNSEQAKNLLDTRSINNVSVTQTKSIQEPDIQRSLDIAKDDLSYYERRVQLQTDSYNKEIELTNISYAKKTLEIDSSNKLAEDKRRLIDLETDLYNKTIDRIKAENNVKNIEFDAKNKLSLLGSQISLIDATDLWINSLNGVPKSINNILNAYNKMQKISLTGQQQQIELDTELAKVKEKYGEESLEYIEAEKQYLIDNSKLKENMLNTEIAGYANLAGALSSMYDEGSKEASALKVVQTSLALVEGTRAIVTAGTGDPYSAIPRMVAMAAMVGGLLSNIGVAFGMNKESTSYDAFSKIEENKGTGTVLGDSEAVSESIGNSLSILEDFAKPQFQVLSEMNKAVQSIESKIAGVTKILINNADFALGKGFVSSSKEFENLPILSDINDAFIKAQDFLLGNHILKKIPIIGDIVSMGSSLLGSLGGKIAGSLFGKTSIKQSLDDSGLYFAETLLTQALDSFEGDMYQVVKTVKKKKSLLSSSTKTSYTSYFQDLDDETNRQFTLILNSLYDTVLTAGLALDSAEKDTAKSLSNFVVNIGKISLKDKKTSEIQEQLTNIFGALGDNLAKTAFPLLTDFQQVGEGMFETLSRVATGMEEAEYYIKSLGREYEDIGYIEIFDKQGNVGFEALLQSITRFEEAIYPVNNNLLLIIENLNTTAEELYIVYSNLEELRDRLIYLGHDAQGLSSDMIMGAGNISNLTDGFTEFFDHFLSEDEQLAYNTKQLTDSFQALNLTLPTSKENFRILLDSIDLTTASGQELYGRLIALSDVFATVSDAKMASDNAKIASDNAKMATLEEFVNSFRNEEQILNLKARKLNLVVASSIEELIGQFNLLSSDILGLTNEELEFLNSSKSIIEAKNNELLEKQKEALRERISAEEKYLNSITSNISKLENIIKSMDATIDKLRGSVVGSTYTLDKFYESMKESLILSKTKDYDDFETSLKDTISYSSSLFEKQNFNSLWDMQFAQIIAANQFESMQNTALTEIDYLKMIEENTSNTVQALKLELERLADTTSSSNSSFLNALEEFTNKLNGKNAIYDLYTKYDLHKYQPDNTGYEYWQKQYESGRSLEQIEKDIQYVLATDPKHQADVKIYDLYTKYDLHKFQTDSSGYNYWEQEYLKGMPFAELEKAFQYSAKIFMLEQNIQEAREWLEKYPKLYSFAVGTPRIPKDLIAQLHQDEMVVPATFSDGVRKGDLNIGNNKELVEEIKEIRKVLQKMDSNLENIDDREEYKLKAGA